MDTITNSRELFIIEIVINYLQSVYPNIYSDKEIIRRYIEYNKLNNKKNLSEINKDVKFTAEENERLGELNILFLGNEDGSSSFYSDLPGNYLMTIRTIKQLINTNNKSIQEAISSVYSLFDNTDITDNSDALNYYLKEIIIPSLLTTLDSSYIDETINTKMSREEHSFDKYKEIENEEMRKNQQKEREKKEEERILEEKEKKESREKKEKRLEVQKLNEKINEEIKQNQKKDKKDTDDKKKNEIKKLKKEFEFNFEKSKTAMILKVKDEKLKTLLKTINDYDSCNRVIIEQTEEHIKNDLIKYCELLEIKKDIGESSDIKEIAKLQKKFNSKKNLEFIFSSNYTKEEDKDKLKNELKDMDEFFKSTEKITIKKTPYGLINKKIANLKELKDKIIISELYNSDIDTTDTYKTDKLKIFMINLLYYFTVLYICVNNIIIFKNDIINEFYILILDNILNNNYFKFDENIKFKINEKFIKLKQNNTLYIRQINETENNDNTKNIKNFYVILSFIYIYYDVLLYLYDNGIHKGLFGENFSKIITNNDTFNLKNMKKFLTDKGIDLSSIMPKIIEDEDKLIKGTLTEINLNLELILMTLGHDYTIPPPPSTPSGSPVIILTPKQEIISNIIKIKDKINTYQTDTSKIDTSKIDDFIAEINVLKFNKEIGEEKIEELEILINKLKAYNENLKIFNNLNQPNADIMTKIKDLFNSTTTDNYFDNNKKDYILKIKEFLKLYIVDTKNNIKQQLTESYEDVRTKLSKIIGNIYKTSNYYEELKKDKDKCENDYEKNIIEIDEEIKKIENMPIKEKDKIILQKYKNYINDNNYSNFIRKIKKNNDKYLTTMKKTIYTKLINSII